MLSLLIDREKEVVTVQQDINIHSWSKWDEMFAVLMKDICAKDKLKA